ncbi:MAG TPA: hypothetical protein VGQ17_18750 [Gemmatimonadales bacterium]|jgi:hypothetical protein|nr:hypothetical protein [Gemmatimonadales bacterium]
MGPRFGLIAGLCPAGGRALVSRPLIALLALLSACASPEAGRVRGGGRGADTGNHGRRVELHAGAGSFAGTPCRLPVPCSRPAPVFGQPW